MTYDLAIGDRGYSSWSLRGWLLFDAFGIPVKTHSARLYTDELPKLLERFGGLGLPKNRRGENQATRPY